MKRFLDMSEKILVLSLPVIAIGWMVNEVDHRVARVEAAVIKSSHQWSNGARDAVHWIAEQCRNEPHGFLLGPEEFFCVPEDKEMSE